MAIKSVLFTLLTGDSGQPRSVLPDLVHPDAAILVRGRYWLLSLVEMSLRQSRDVLPVLLKTLHRTHSAQLSSAEAKFNRFSSVPLRLISNSKCFPRRIYQSL